MLPGLNFEPWQCQPLIVLDLQGALYDLVGPGFPKVNILFKIKSPQGAICLFEKLSVTDSRLPISSSWKAFRV